MEQNTRHDIVQRLSTVEGARGIFGQILNGSAEGKTALAVIINEPSTALAMLNRGSTELGLADKQAADVLEEILGGIADRRHARALMTDHLLPRRRAELLIARSDLPAVAADIASPEDLLIAVMGDLLADKPLVLVAVGAAAPSPSDDDEEDEPQQGGDGNAAVDNDDEEDDDPPSDEEIALEADAARPGQAAIDRLEQDAKIVDLDRLVAWASKLKDHPEYQGWLELDFAGFSVRDRVLFAIWRWRNEPEDTEILLSDLLDCGLEDTDLNRLKRVVGHPDIELTMGELRAFHTELMPVASLPEGENSTLVASAASLL